MIYLRTYIIIRVTYIFILTARRNPYTPPPPHRVDPITVRIRTKWPLA